MGDFAPTFVLKLIVRGNFASWLEGLVARNDSTNLMGIDFRRGYFKITPQSRF